jgi:hypothetical protein
MWLSSPAARLSDIPSLGLSKLVASTIELSLPTHVVLREFDENLTRFNQDELASDDIAMVANSVAIKSVKKLEQLNVLAKTDREQFCSDVLSIAEAERERVRKLEASRLQFQKQAEQLRKETNTKNQLIEDQLEKAHLELRQFKEAKIENLDREILERKRTTDSAKKESKHIFAILQVGGILIVCEVLVLVIMHFGWQDMEPILYVLGIFGTLLLSFVLKKRLFAILNWCEEKVHDWVIQKRGVPDSIIEDLKKERALLKDELRLTTTGQQD